MTVKVQIKQLTSIEQLQELVHVEKAVWKMPPTPVHQTFTAMNNGGIILGAYLEEKMIGFLYSFAGYNGKIPYLCSHMLGILPQYRTSGLGIEMKKKQAEIAKQLGYRMITWTFDPLESKNAYINLHKLGARGAFYHENHYGNLNDQLNQGLPTDRIQIVWDITKAYNNEQQALTPFTLLLNMNEKGYPVITANFQIDLSLSNDWFVAIPNDFQTLKQERMKLAQTWRFESRNVFQALYKAGFTATDLIYEPTKKVSYYLFSNGGFTDDATIETN